MKTKLRYALLGLAFMMGCNESAESTDSTMTAMGVKPGTRLTPKLLLADDGTIFLHPSTWRDSELNIECAFRHTADDKYRCLPLVPVQKYAVYLDQACINEVYQRPPSACGDVPSMVIVESPASSHCDEPTARVLTVGKKVTVGTLFLSVDGLCTPAIQGGPNTFLLESEIALDSYVSAWR